MTEVDNIEKTKFIHHIHQSAYDENKDIIWPTVVGIFVVLALGWMICRYKCSSQERSPYSVRCCPKSLCKRIRLCCLWTFRRNIESQQQQQQRNSSPNIRTQMSKESILEIPFMIYNATNRCSSLSQPCAQWPSQFLLSNNQQSSFPIATLVQPTINSSQPKRHPLRRESVLLLNTEHGDGRCRTTSWPFSTINLDFRKETPETKFNHLFFNV